MAGLFPLKAPSSEGAFTLWSELLTEVDPDNAAIVVYLRMPGAIARRLCAKRAGLH